MRRTAILEAGMDLGWGNCRELIVSATRGGRGDRGVGEGGMKGKGLRREA